MNNWQAVGYIFLGFGLIVFFVGLFWAFNESSLYFLSFGGLASIGGGQTQALIIAGAQKIFLTVIVQFIAGAALCWVVAVVGFVKGRTPRSIMPTTLEASKTESYNN